MVAMPKAWRTKTRTIRDDSWGPTETVSLRTFFGDADRQRVLSASFEYRVDEQGNTRSVYTLDRMHAVRRTCAVTGWTLLDSDGDPLAFTTEVLLNLPSEVASFIDEEISKEWGSLGVPAATKEEAEAQEKEEKDSSATFHGHSEGAVNGSGPDLNLGKNDQGGDGNRAVRRSTPTQKNTNA